MRLGMLETRVVHNTFFKYLFFRGHQQVFSLVMNQAWQVPSETTSAPANTLVVQNAEWSQQPITELEIPEIQTSGTRASEGC
jgi:hypothetical protein